MSLARIITRNPQDAFAVSEYLRSEGYTVETVSPGEFRITPAEVELDLNRCKKGEAVDRARALVESHRGTASTQTEVPAVSEHPQPQKAKIPVAYDIVGTPVAFAEEEEPEGQEAPKGTGSALASLLSRLTAPVRELQQRSAAKRALKLEAEQERRREQELARERVRQERERQLAEWHRQEQAEAALDENPVFRQLPAPGPELARPFAARRRSSSVVISGKAVAIGCAAGILVVLGLVANANRRPASPLSPGDLMLNTSVKQEVPFGPVTITPPSVPKPSPVVTRKILPTAGPSQGKSGAGRRPQSTASAAKLKQHSDTN